MISNYGLSFWDWDHWKYDEYGNFYYDYNESNPVYCYNDNPGPNGEKPYEMFTNPSDLLYLKQRMRYHIARWGYSTQIYEWEILSEPWHLDAYDPVGTDGPSYVPYSDSDTSSFPLQQHVKQAIYNYEKVISNYIKDSLNHPHQLVGIDIHYDLPVFNGVTLPNIDIIGINPYTKYPDDVYGINNFAFEINKKRILYGGLNAVPIMIPEGGTDNTYDECSNFAMRPVDAMSLGFTGVAGFHFWDGHTPNPDGSFPVNLWKPIYRAQAHMNGQDVVSTLGNGSGSQGWMHVKEEADIKEHTILEQQYYLSHDKNMAVGYIYNRTHNVFTRGTQNSDCKSVDIEDKYKVTQNIEWKDPKKKDRLRIRNLHKKTYYHFDWYSGKGQNDYIKSDSIKTKKKDGDWGITLEFPELTSNTTGSDRPVVWFVMHKDYNSGMIQNNTATENLQIQNKKITAGITRNEVPLLTVFPNPFRNNLNIVSPKSDIVEIQTIEGKTVIMKSIEKGLSSISTSKLATGLYFVKFKRQHKTFKIVKQ